MTIANDTTPLVRLNSDLNRTASGALPLKIRRQLRVATLFVGAAAFILSVAAMSVPNGIARVDAGFMKLVPSKLRDGTEARLRSGGLGMSFYSLDVEIPKAGAQTVGAFGNFTAFGHIGDFCPERASRLQGSLISAVVACLAGVTLVAAAALNVSHWGLVCVSSGGFLAALLAYALSQSATGSNFSGCLMRLHLSAPQGPSTEVYLDASSMAGFDAAAGSWLLAAVWALFLYAPLLAGLFWLKTRKCQQTAQADVEGVGN